MVQCCNLRQSFQKGQNLNFFRMQPSFLKLKDEIAAGSIGKVTDVNAQFGIKIDADRVLKKDLGGGALLDIGIYW